ncbi:hypothetical protein PUN28_019265 [Cardiocondyla obscurior]|uniref:Cytochrome P450 9e2 n=1 Tax=Cardiocondyla obscurior TaxID=286306 RepID=A0AAW2EDF9_9HYME
MIYIIILSAIAGTLGLYYFLFKDLNYFERHGVPHVKPFPLVGNMGPTILRRQSTIDFVKSMYDLYPDAKYIGVYDLNNNKTIMLRDPELIKSVTMKHFDMFMDRTSFVDESVDPFFGKNLVVLRGERWREVRAILSPAFTSSKMKNMFKLMSDCGVDFSDYLAKLPPEKRTLDVKDLFTRYTNDVIATCALGISVDSIRNPKSDFYMHGVEATNLKSTIIFKLFILKALPWLARMLKLSFISRKAVNFFRDLIKTTIKARDENNIVRPDMLQLMMESRDKDGKIELSIDDMIAQAFIFFFGGFENSATIMCFAAHEIAMNQNVQRKLQNEIDQVMENASEQQASYEAINSMEYLDAVINETLRMYPVVITLDRQCLKDFELPSALPGTKPFTIKKGQSVWIPAYGLQRDPKYFEDPERFDPERFCGERKKNSLNCGGYFPFGLGPRMCIGNRFALLETKVLLFHLLARCKLVPCDKTPKSIKFAKSFTMKPEGGFWLNVISRKNFLLEKNIS